MGQRKPSIGSCLILRYSFCTISWTGIERLTLTHHECEQLFFPHRLTLHHLFCYQIDACGNSQKGYNGFSIHPFMTCHFYLQAKICSRMCTGTKKMDVFPSGLSLGDIPEGYSVLPRVAPEEKGKSRQGFNGEKLDITLGCHQVCPWCISTPPRW